MTENEVRAVLEARKKELDSLIHVHETSIRNHRDMIFADIQRLEEAQHEREKLVAHLQGYAVP